MLLLALLTLTLNSVKSKITVEVSSHCPLSCTIHLAHPLSTLEKVFHAEFSFMYLYFRAGMEVHDLSSRLASHTCYLRRKVSLLS